MCVYKSCKLSGQALAKEMAQEIKALVAKPDNLSSTPRTHTVEGETDSCSLTSDLYIYTMAHIHPTHAPKINKYAI